MADRLSPDVVLMDVNLPGLDGIAATQELAFRVPRTAVIIHSMHDDNVTIGRALAAGAVAFVGKQQPDGDLLAAIRMAGGQRKEGNWGSNGKERSWG
jgi:pilus assembly protein CpaE